jgi:CheY-like chemotaxis protein
MTTRARTEAITEDIPLHVVFRPPRVLVVDAELALRGRIAGALLRLGCHPVEATHGEEAWSWVIANRFDLVLVSQSLAGMSGADLVRRIRASSQTALRALPVIGLTNDEECERELAEAGAECLVRWPYHEADLMRAIRQIAETHWAEALEEAI